MKDWTVDDVCRELSSVGLASKEDAVRKNKIDGAKLAILTKQDLEEMGFTPLQAKKILQLQNPRSESTVASSKPATSNVVVAGTYVAPTVTTPPKPAPAATPPTETETLPYSRERTVFKMDAFGYETRVEGFESQMVTIDLGPSHAIQAEPGALIYMTDGVIYTTKTDGKGWGRLVTGQRIFLTEWTYQGPQGTKGTVAFSSEFPSRVIPVDLSQHGGRILCQRGSLLCCSKGIDTRIAFTKKLAAGFFGGTGFILQSLEGNGHVFLNGGGVVIEKQLEKGQSLRVSTGSLVGFESSVRYEVELTGTLFDAFFGREGLFFTTLRGPGKVWLESLPVDRFVSAISDRLPRKDSNESDGGNRDAKVLLGGAALVAGLVSDEKRTGRSTRRR